MRPFLKCFYRRASPYIIFCPPLIKLSVKLMNCLGASEWNVSFEEPHFQNFLPLSVQGQISDGKKKKEHNNLWMLLVSVVIRSAQKSVHSNPLSAGEGTR